MRAHKTIGALLGALALAACQTSSDSLQYPDETWQSPRPDPAPVSVSQPLPAPPVERIAEAEPLPTPPPVVEAMAPPPPPAEEENVPPPEPPPPAVAADDDRPAGAAAVAAPEAKAAGIPMEQEEADLRRAFAADDLSMFRDGDSLVLQIDGGMLFDPQSSALTPRGRDVVQALSAVFTRYPSTYVNVDGFTEGSRLLSQERADAFAIELQKAGVQANRLSALGHDGAPSPTLEITLEPVAG